MRKRFIQKKSVINCVPAEYFQFALIAVLLFTAPVLAESQYQPAALEYTLTRPLQLVENLDGNGITITSVCRSMTYKDGEPQMDYAWNTAHKCFAGGDINLSDGIGTVSSHATSIGGILVGFDLNANDPFFGEFEYIGAAPAAKVRISEFCSFLNDLLEDSAEIETDILTMSVGVVFESWWTRRLEQIAAEKGTLIIAGIGNGNDVFDPAYYPAAGANIIGVGVIDPVINATQDLTLKDFTLPRPAHSSFGPTADGRCGVDIVAPGNCLVPDANSIDGYKITGSWSSFATPIVAGTAALLQQYAKSDQQFSAAVAKDGGNCVMKAILLNSARKLPYWHKGKATPEDDHEYSLDFLQGAGALDAISAFKQLKGGFQGVGDVEKIGWDSDRIGLGDLKYYRFEVDEPGNEVITVTLTWNRHFKSEFPFEADTDADRDLRVELWGSKEGAADSAVLLDYSDTKDDNIEHIHVQTRGEYDVYEIIVTCKNPSDGVKNDDSGERYALAWRVSEKVKEREREWCDLDGNGSVGLEDLEILVNRVNQSADSKNGYITGDLNMDGVIDATDIMILAKEIQL